MGQCSHLNPDLLRVEVGVTPVVRVVDALELGEGTGRADRDVVGVKVRVDDESTVEHETRVVARCNNNNNEMTSQ